MNDNIKDQPFALGLQQDRPIEGSFAQCHFQGAARIKVRQKATTALTCMPTWFLKA